MVTPRLLLLTVLSYLASSSAAVLPRNSDYAKHIICGARAKVTLENFRKAEKLAKITDQELDQLLKAYTNATGFQRLGNGLIGDKPHPAAKQLYHSTLEATRDVLKMCAEDGGLVPGYRKAGSWAVPGVPTLPECGKKKLHLVVITREHIKPGPSVTDEMWPSFRARGLPLPAHMLKLGHEASWFSEKEHAHLFNDCLSSSSKSTYTPPFPDPQEAIKRGVHVVGLVVKTRPENIMRCLHKYNIPVVLDLIDSSIDRIKEEFLDYKLILATNRLAAEIMTVHTNTRSVPIYHQPANYQRFHRADRTPPVKVIAMTHGGESHALETSELAQQIDTYCRKNQLNLRLHHYAGHGYDQDEMARYMAAPHDWGHQIGYSMGYSSVDIGVVWRPCSVVELTCIKPTNRVAQYLSLGIPVVFKATAAYADIVALSGYPLVAHNVTHAMQLIDMLVKDPTLRQATSELGLQIAERFHQDVIADEFTRAMCSVIE